MTRLESMRLIRGNQTRLDRSSNQLNEDKWGEVCMRVDGGKRSNIIASDAFKTVSDSRESFFANPDV